jgi:hypothetical protein
MCKAEGTPSALFCTEALDVKKKMCKFAVSFCLLLFKKISAKGG